LAAEKNVPKPKPRTPPKEDELHKDNEDMYICTHYGSSGSSEDATVSQPIKLSS
jgi:hypothetical protein